MNYWSRLAAAGVNLSPASNPNQRVKKPLVYAGLALTLVLFGDTLLPVLIHGIILALEVLEALSDHILESVFHASPWTAQLITAWSGFFIFLALLAMGIMRVRRAYRVMKVRFTAWLDSLHG